MLQTAVQKNSQDIHEITDGEFELFRDFFYRKTGIKFENSKHYFVDKRIVERINKTGKRDFRTYFTFVRFQKSGEELQQLINSMTVNETYFYREEYQFQCLTESVLNEVVKNSRGVDKPLRIWSVPSSTGEEPYSIAIYLIENWPMIDSIDVEILASDIDSKVLDKCNKGVYSERSVQNLPKRVLKKYFTKKIDGSYQICNDLRGAITFSKVNLSDSVHSKKIRGIDIVFCRNLLIYFDDESRRQAAEVFFDALNPGGFIFLGHSESMSRISPLFKVKKFPRAIVYQKPM